MTTHVSDAKKNVVKKILDLISQYNIIGAVDMENLPAPQLQKIREQLRDKLAIFMTKRRVMKIALERAKDSKKGIENLIPHLKGMPALIFTNENPFKLFKTLKQSKSAAPAKAGQIAPKDLVIPAGPTSFMPGPIIGELGALGIKAGVEGGKVAIKEDSTVVREGEEITPKVAELLVRFSIEPMEVGLNVTATYENGVIFDKKVLDIDEDKFNADLRSAISGAFNVAIYVGYPTKDTIEPLLAKAFNEAKALGLSENIIDKGIIDDLLAKAERGMLSLKSTANIEVTEMPKEAPKAEEKPKEEPKVEEKPAEVKPEAPKEEEKPVEQPKPEEKKEEPKPEPKPEPKVEEKPAELLKPLEGEEKKEEAEKEEKKAEEMKTDHGNHILTKDEKTEEEVLEEEKAKEAPSLKESETKEEKEEEKLVAEKAVEVRPETAVVEKKEMPVVEKKETPVVEKKEAPKEDLHEKKKKIIREMRKEEKEFEKEVDEITKKEIKQEPEKKEEIKEAAKELKGEIKKEEKQAEKEINVDEKIAKMVEQTKQHAQGTAPTAASVLEEVKKEPPKPKPKPENAEGLEKVSPKDDVPSIQELVKNKGKKAPNLGVSDVEGVTDKESKKEGGDVPSIQELTKQKEKKKAEMNDVENLAKELIKKGTLRR